MLKSIQKIGLATMLLVTVLLLGCPKNKEDNSAKLPNSIVVKKATKQKFSGGAGGASSRGIIYRVTMQYKLSDTLTIDTLWIGEQFKKHELTVNDSIVDFLTGSGTAEIAVFKYIKDKNSDIPPPPPPPSTFPIDNSPKKEKIEKPKPPSYEGEALIIYRLKKEKNSAAVESFKELKQIETQ